jgi:hypothetical protein
MQGDGPGLAQPAQESPFHIQSLKWYAIGAGPDLHILGCLEQFIPKIRVSQTDQGFSPAQVEVAFRLTIPYSVTR